MVLLSPSETQDQRDAAGWMHELARHDARIRREHPEHDLVVVFDIDGTILDMRYAVHHVLHTFDRVEGTEWFRGLEVTDVTVHENQVAQLLAERGLPTEVASRVERFYRRHFWSEEAVLASHRPFRGVMDVIRWFQLRPRTQVALNTGRPEELRESTLRSLNALGREYRVTFDSELLGMNQAGWDTDVPAAKIRSLEDLRRRGLRVIAVVDNEPANLEAMRGVDPEDEILFLHAETIYESTPTTPLVGGSLYDLTDLVHPDDLPEHVHLVWHAVNDLGQLDAFLSSPVQWAECDVRRDPFGRLVLRDQSFDHVTWSPEEPLLRPDDLVRCLNLHRRSVKLDLKDGPGVVDAVLGLLDDLLVTDDRIWFNAEADRFGEEGFRRLASARPGAVLQTPVDGLAPLLADAPRRARRELERLARWGITRYSVGWSSPHARRVVEQLGDWGYEVNVYAIPDLEAFLQAALLLPRSVTAALAYADDPSSGRPTYSVVA